MRKALPFVFVAAAACGSSPRSDHGMDPDQVSDPFADPPDTSEGLTNVSADLDAVLEHGALATACADYAAAPTDRRKRLLCGKAMFFDESFGTTGIPKPIAKWLVDKFPQEVGTGFEKLGMIADPRATDGMPLGLPLGPKLGSVDSVSFGCASCHFGRLPDGRYAVGAPNHDYAYGRMILMLTLLPALSMPGADPGAHDPDALAAIQPLRDRMQADSSIGTALIQALLPLLGSGNASLPPFDRQNEHWYARWRDGTMDFFIQPLPFDDKVHTVSKISALWGIPTSAELAAAGAESGMLGWTGSTASIRNFLAGFVELGGGKPADWPDDKLAPLADYIESLRAPLSPTRPESTAVARGRGVFVSAGCQDCHGGPRGMGTTVYGYDEIGTDDAMATWADGADKDGELCCGLTLQPGDRLTRGIKSPRLNGLWAMRRFLHNGALDNLDQLLCLAPRPGVSALAFGDAGHEYGCELAEGERRDLVAYMLAH